MGPRLDSLDEARASITPELTSHNTAITAMDALTNVVATETTYDDRVKNIMTSMWDQISFIGTHCMNQSHVSVQTKNYTSLVNQLRQEGSNHKTAMSAATTLEAAKDEEVRHQAAAASIVTKMENEAKLLRAQESNNVCMLHDGHQH